MITRGGSAAQPCLGRRGLRGALVIESQRCRFQGPPPAPVDTLGLRRLRASGAALNPGTDTLCSLWPPVLLWGSLWLGEDFAISSEAQVAQAKDLTGVVMAKGVESVLVVISSGSLTRILQIASPKGLRLGNCRLRKGGGDRKSTGEWGRVRSVSSQSLLNPYTTPALTPPSRAPLPSPMAAASLQGWSS